MILFRSLIFAVVFYVYSGVMAVLAVPVLLLPARYTLALFRIWSRGMLFLLNLICGVRVEIRGRQFIPQGGGLIAAKHQCMLDTMALWPTLPGAAYVSKKELVSIPFYGWYLLKAGTLVVDRDGGAAALAKMLRDAKARVAEGRPVLIYPEGTRTPPGETIDYKPGVAGLYRDLGVACVPMATNSGVHWPAHGFLRRPGVIVYEFLEPIPSGLKRAEFMRELRTRIETASSALLTH